LPLSDLKKMDALIHTSIRSDDVDLIRRITEFVAEAADISPNEIEPDDDLFSQVGIDSLGIVMVYVEISMAFGTPEPAPDADLKNINTVSKLAAFVREATK
jgi:acyl carrier protein